VAGPSVGVGIIETSRAVTGRTRTRVHSLTCTPSHLEQAAEASLKRGERAEASLVECGGGQVRPTASKDRQRSTGPAGGQRQSGQPDQSADRQVGAQQQCDGDYEPLGVAE